MRQLPSLNALKAFEACARHCSFTLAAEELLVTQSAISRQVRALESYLGVQLFLRQPRRIELTEQGRTLLPVLTHIFDRLASLTVEVQRAARKVRIKLPPTFAIRWLIPRLHQFERQNPGVEVLLNTGWNPVDFMMEDFDAGIVCESDLHRFDHQTKSALIAEERVTPVCAPELLEHSPAIHSPADLSHFTMLHGSELFDVWGAWFKAIGHEPPANERSQMFDLMDTAVHAAARGIGVALATPQFIAEDISLGRLVVLLPEAAPVLSGYYLVWPQRSATHQGVAKIRDWLTGEAQVEWDKYSLVDGDMNSEIANCGFTGSNSRENGAADSDANTLRLD